MRAAIALSILCVSTAAQAWPLPARPAALPEPDPEPAPEPEPEPAPMPVPVVVEVPKPDELAERIDDLEERAKKLERNAHANDAIAERVKTLLPLVGSVPITAFIDVGAFAVSGNGSGIRSDFLHQHYPGYRNQIAGQWVFMGDPFTTAINTLGDPADTADSREVEHDAINSSGRPSMIVNSVGLAIGKHVANGVWISALAQLLPRSGPDVLQVDYAHIDYRPSQKYDFILETGKIDSVLGVEYRSQDAPSRIGVTPSLICRYTCGRPIGVDARLVRGRLGLSAAIVNGDNFEERFEAKPELKANKAPTIAGHVQWILPFGQGLELGASGAVGPQDNQPNLDIHQWHYGVDLKLTDLARFDIIAEFVQGRQQGSTTGDPAVDRMVGIERPACDVAQCLHYKGAYVFVDRRVNRWFTPYARFDWRDATHRHGGDFIYEANSIRATVGAHFEMTSRIIAKIEYDWNHELNVPSFPHDVITSSIVVATD